MSIILFSFIKKVPKKNEPPSTPIFPSHLSILCIQGFELEGFPLSWNHIIIFDLLVTINRVVHYFIIHHSNQQNPLLGLQAFLLLRYFFHLYFMQSIHFWLGWSFRERVWVAEMVNFVFSFLYVADKVDGEGLELLQEPFKIASDTFLERLYSPTASSTLAIPAIVNSASLLQVGNCSPLFLFYFSYIFML